MSCVIKILVVHTTDTAIPSQKHIHYNEVLGTERAVCGLSRSRARWTLQFLRTGEISRVSSR
jgi:hypothetical protein